MDALTARHFRRYGRPFFIYHTSPPNTADRKTVMNYHTREEIDQFRYIKIQSQTIDLRTRLWGINPTNSVFVPQSLVLRSIV